MTYDGWAKKSTITVANPPTQDGYQVLVAVPKRAAMQADYDDLRFALSDGTLLLYAIESYDASYAYCRVKAPLNCTSFVCYYGNDAATGESDPANVFEFWHDFPGSSLDTSVFNTYSSGAGISVSGGLLTITGSTANHRGVQAKIGGGQNTAMLVRAKIPDVVNCPLGYMASDLSSFCTFGPLEQSGQDSTNTYVAGYETKIKAFDNSAYHIWEIKRNGSASVIFSVDRTTFATHTTKIPGSGVTLYPTAYIYQQTATYLLDWIAIRKCQSAEPVCTFGAEEEARVYVPKTVRLLYDIADPAGKVFRAKYDVCDPVGKAFRAVYDVALSPFGRRLRGVYDVIQFTTKSVRAPYRIVAGRSVRGLFDIDADLHRTLRGVYDITNLKRLAAVYRILTDRRVRGVYSATSEKTVRGVYSVLEPAGLRARFVVQILNKSFLTVVSDHRLTVKLDQLPYYKCTFRNPPPIYRDTYIKEGNEIRVLYNDVVLFSGTITSTEKIAGSQNIAVEAWGSEKDLEALKVQSKSQFVTTPANEIAEALLPDAWEGEIDVMPAISYTTEYGDILTHVANLAAITGRDWSARQTVATVTVEDIVGAGDYVWVVVSGDTLTADTIDCYAFVLTGPDVYKGAQVFSANSSTLVFAGDPFPRLRIGDRMSVYLRHRLDLTERPTSGTAKFKALLNRGIKKVSRTLDLERVYSVIVVPGASSMAANQSSVFPVVTIPSHWAETTVTESMLADQGADICLSAAATSIILSDATDYPASGVVGIEAEQIRYTGKTGNTLTGCTRGVNGTAAAAHNIFAPVLLVSEYPMRNTGFLAASGSVWMGMEKVSYTAKREGSILGLTRGVGTRAYPHGSGTVVRNAAYTVAAPEAGSPYALYGERALNVPAVGAVDQHTLDVVAQTYARFSTSLTEWGEGTLARPSLPNGMRVGDWFTLGEYIDGVLTDTDYRVVGVELDGKTCKMFFGETEEFILDRLRGIDKAMDMAGIKDDKPGIGTVVGISVNKEVVKVQMGDGSYTYSRLK